MDIAEYNAAWLKAWSEKDVERLLKFYATDTEYRDGQVPQGLKGHGELRGYLESLFERTPPMTYVPEQVWEVDGGYCGRWLCTIELPDNSRRYLRGFDLVLLDGEEITLNEVYTHDLGSDPAGRSKRTDT